MIRYFLLSTVLFFALFFRFPEGFQSSPAVVFMGAYDLSRQRPISLERSLGRYPVQSIAILSDEKGEENRVKKIIHLNGSITTPEKDQLVYVPPHAPGFFSYRKASDTIFFHSREGEILWERSYHSYPVSDNDGGLVFMLTGDGNRVDLLDQNGNLLPAGSISGNILNDYDFADSRDSACASFSNVFTIVGEDGEATASFRIPEESLKEDEVVFMKSCAISGDGKMSALHLQKDTGDFLYLFRIEEKKNENPEEGKPAKLIELKKIEEISLPRVYPHLLHMAINEYGVLVGSPDRTVLFSLSGKKLIERETSIDQGNHRDVYRPVYAGSRFFAWGEKNRLYVSDREGVLIGEYPVKHNEKESPDGPNEDAILEKSSGKNNPSPEPDQYPWRIVAGKTAPVFFIQSRQALVFYRWEDGQEGSEQ